MTRLVVGLVILAGSVGLLGQGAASAASRRADVCAKGTTPVVAGKGGRLVARRDARGRVRCRKLRTGVPTAPASSAAGQLGRVADTLGSGLQLDSSALGALQRRVGRKRAGRLVDLALKSWRSRAGAAAARAHVATSESFTLGEGVKGTVEYGSREITGEKLGVAADATAEITVDREGLEKAGDAVKDKLPKEFLGAGAKVELSFEDAPAACPSATGRVPGRLRAKGTLTITVRATSGTFTIKGVAEVDVRYTATVADNARWNGLTDVDVQTTFQLAATGTATRTYRGRIAGGSFGRESWFPSGSSGVNRSAVEREFGSVSNWRTSGPKGSWDLNKGVSLQDLRSLENIKSMAAATYATVAAAGGAIEWLRQKSMPRVEKHWYDQEACLTLEGSAADSKLAPKATTTVTARNAKAKDGTAVAATLAASGTATLTPGSAPLAAGGTKDFTLTAPDKGSATWQVVALSRAGKKTVAGKVPVEDAVPVALRIVGYTDTLRSDTDKGWTLRTDTLKSAGPATLPLSCDETDDPDCGRKFELRATVNTTRDGVAFGPPPNCPYAYPTYQQENPGSLVLLFDPAGTGPATVTQPVPIASVGDVGLNICGAYSISSDNLTAQTTAAREDVLSGREFTITLQSTGTAPTAPFSATPTIQRAWTKTVKLQRVKPDGSPYP